MKGDKRMKYTGFFNCLRTVAKEEGYKKLIIGGLHPRFMFNMLNGFMFLFLYDQFVFNITAGPKGGKQTISPIL